MIVTTNILILYSSNFANKEKNYFLPLIFLGGNFNGAVSTAL